MLLVIYVPSLYIKLHYIEADQAFFFVSIIKIKFH